MKVRVKFIGHGGNNQLVQAIKEVRSLTYLGLKEAKDMINCAKNGPEGGIYDLPQSHSCDINKLNAQINQYGYKVINADLPSEEFANHREVLHVMIADAVAARNYDLVEDVLALLRKHF